MKVKNKTGNVTMMIFPIGIMLIIIFLAAYIFIYFQITTQIHDVKSNIFYIAQTSLSGEDLEKLAYNDFSLNKEIIKNNIDYILKKNFLRNDNLDIGITSIECSSVDVIYNKIEVQKHTMLKYNQPVLCVKVKLKFTPIMKLLGENIDVVLHDDVKLALLELN